MNRLAKRLLVCACALSTARAEEEAFPSIKGIPLGASENIHLSLGGDLRERYESYNEPSFGLRGIGQDDYLLQRVLLSADLSAGDYFRVFAQLGSHVAMGKQAPVSPTDVDEFDIQQAYVDFGWPLDPDSKLLLRTGRQEITFGSGRLVSVRDGANIRRSFDGARLTYTSGGLKVDAFAARTVDLENGGLNDATNTDESLWGLYSVLPVAWLPDGHADFHYLGLDRHDAVFEQGTALEKRHSFGTRLWGNPGSWDYNYEAVIQCGTFGSADILAWTLATDTGYTFASLPWKPRIGLKADIASGDPDSNDGRLSTFNALFPKQPYFSEASLIAPSNIIDLHPTLEFQITDEISFTTDWDFFWKHRSDDAVYSPPGRPLVEAGQSDSHYVGSQANVGIEWQVNPCTSWAVYYSHFFAGPAVTGAGGRDVDFAGSWIEFQF
ncbi:MAG: alginate export family protein [Luteolibacter sp.]